MKGAFGATALMKGAFGATALMKGAFGATALMKHSFGAAITTFASSSLLSLSQNRLSTMRAIAIAHQPSYVPDLWITDI
jgi:hypothetical protein